MIRRNAAILTLAAVLCAGTAATAQVLGDLTRGAVLNREGVRLEALGRVREVVDRNTFVLNTDGMTFRIFAPRNAVLGNDTVRAGDRVRVYGDLKSGERINADRVQIVDRGRDNDNRGGNNSGGNNRQSRTVEGPIRQIERQQNRMVITVPAGNVRVTWDKDTNFIRNGRQSTIRDFKDGERVRVVGERTAINTIDARRIIFGGKAGWTNGAVGEIVALDSRNRQAEVDFDGEVWTVNLERARFQGRGNSRFDMNSLRLGQDVRVSGSANGNRRVNATSIELVRDRR